MNDTLQALYDVILSRKAELDRRGQKIGNLKQFHVTDKES